MAYASQLGKARVSTRNPQAAAICDRCGFVYNFVDLQWQMDWRGPVIQNIRILVCNDCLDTPQEQLRAIVLPADPTPIINARPQDFVDAETNYRTVSYPTVIDPTTGLPIPPTAKRITPDCQQRTINPFGVPVGLDQNAIMPYDSADQMAYGVPLSVLSVTSDGSSTVTVTCSEPTGLGLNSQVSVEGLSFGYANGFYTVTVISATSFSYMTYGSNPANSLLTPTTRIVTALVGLPRGYDQIPKIIGPPLTLPPAVCFLETEDGTGEFLLEDGSGVIQLESCAAGGQTYYFEIEDASGAILLEDGTDFLELENGP